MHKVFVSFHHDNDQKYKDSLVKWGVENNIFIDGSVDMGEIPDDWTSQQIREYIRDEHLKDTSVTILLVGTETKNRKHIDWELFSSMYDGKKNKKSGILVINLPSVDCKYHTLCSQEEKTAVLPDVKKAILALRPGRTQVVLNLHAGDKVAAMALPGGVELGATTATDFVNLGIKVEIE